MTILLTILKWGWITYLVTQSILYVIKHRKWITAYKQIDFRLFLSAIPLVLLTILSFMALLHLNESIFGWSWLLWVGNLLGVSDVRAVNLSLVGTDIPVLGIGICILLLIQLPALALLEERFCRKGTKGWRDGLLRSIAFGLVHCLVGVPLAVGIALIIPGLWYTHLYFQGGVKRSAQGHFQYNLLVMLIVLAGAVLATIQIL